MKTIRNLTLMILTMVYCLTLTVGASSYVPSPTPGRPVVIDPDGLTDILVVTPYRFRSEMLQQYKIDNFEIADVALTQAAMYAALEAHVTEDMNPEYLALAAHYYVHEKEDRGIVQIPVTITVATDLDFGDGYVDDVIGRAAVDNTTFLHLIQYNEDGTWSRVPATFRADGTFTFTVDHYGAYAIVTYRVHEGPDRPHHPDHPGRPGHPGKPSQPQSPQTGEADPFLVPPVLAAGLLAVLVLKKLREPRA